MASESARLALDPHDVEELFNWHGGQSSAVYALASTAMNHTVSADMIESALFELRKDLKREEGRVYLHHHGSNGGDRLSAERLKAHEENVESLGTLINNLEVVLAYPEEHQLERLGNPVDWDAVRERVSQQGRRAYAYAKDRGAHYGRKVADRASLAAADAQDRASHALRRVHEEHVKHIDGETCVCTKSRQDNPFHGGNPRETMDEHFERVRVVERAGGRTSFTARFRVWMDRTFEGAFPRFDDARRYAEKLAEEFGSETTIRDVDLGDREDVVWRSSGAQGHHRRDNPARGADRDLEALLDSAKASLDNGNDWKGEHAGFALWIGAPSGSREGEYEGEIRRRGVALMLHNRTWPAFQKNFLLQMKDARKAYPEEREDNPVRDPILDREAEEQGEVLAFEITSDGTLYPLRKEIETALRKKMARGVYDSRRAPQAFAHYVDEGAKKLAKEQGDGARWFDLYPAGARRVAARIIAENVEAEMKIESREADADREIYEERSPLEGGKKRDDNPVYPALGPERMDNPVEGPRESRDDNPVSEKQKLPLKLMQPRLGNPAVHKVYDAPVGGAAAHRTAKSGSLTEKKALAMHDIVAHGYVRPETIDIEVAKALLDEKKIKLVTHDRGFPIYVSVKNYPAPAAGRARRAGDRHANPAAHYAQVDVLAVPHPDGHGWILHEQGYVNSKDDEESVDLDSTEARTKTEARRNAISIARGWLSRGAGSSASAATAYLDGTEVWHGRSKRADNPLKSGCSKEVISENIEHELHKHPDMPVAQGVAIAYSHARAEGCKLPSRRRANPVAASGATEVADVILEQLGGMSRLGMMVGAKNFVALEHGVQFSIGSGAKSGINKVRVVLLPSDTYDVEFWKIHGAKMKKISEWGDVYNNQLMDLFEKETGMYLTIKPRKDNPAGCALCAAGGAS